MLGEKVNFFNELDEKRDKTTNNNRERDLRKSFPFFPYSRTYIVLMKSLKPHKGKGNPL